MRFDWTSRRDDATVPVTICIGHEILRGIELPGRKIAWLIESPALSQGIHRFIEGNLDQVLDAFELILTPDRSLCALDPKIRYHPAGSNLPWIATEDYGIYPKTKLCSMIASAKTMVAGHNVRQEYARMLKDRIDLFGGACGSPKIMGERTHFDKREGLVPYMFSVTMENCKVDFYYTEKIMDCFVTGTVPIYWGSHAIGELFDEKGIIRLDEDFEPESISEELYYSMMPYIKHNFEVAKNIEGADDLLFNRYIRQYA